MRNLELGFGAFIFVLFGLAAYTSFGFHRLAMYFPFAVSVIGLILSGVYVLKLVVTRRRVDAESSSSESGAGPVGPESTAEFSGDAVSEIRKALPYLAWFIGYILLISLVGVVVASALFLAAFLLREARMRWWGVLISVVSTLVILFAFSSVMRLYWPRNLLGF